MPLSIFTRLFQLWLDTQFVPRLWRLSTTIIIIIIIIIISAIVSPLQGESLPRLVRFTSVLGRSHPCHASKLPQFHLSILFFVVPDFGEPVLIFVYLLSLVLARCPAYLHFLILTCFIISWILVCSLIHLLVFLSLLVIPSIHLSMFLCVVQSYCSIFVIAQVSAPFLMVIYIGKKNATFQAYWHVTLHNVITFFEGTPSSLGSPFNFF